MKTLLVVALAFGCSGGHAGPVHPDHRAPAAADAPPAPATTSPTTAECELLFDHALSVATAGDRKLTDDERAKARAGLHDELAAECLAMPRAAYACAMAAPSMQELAACDQETPSSSTSKSSVAPGGITPAAPRSP